MNRWKAFLLHLLLSLVVISGIAATALLVWYPYGLYKVSGLDRLMLVMLSIDITAGPLLTLLVYKHGKPSLRFDLAVISLVQLAFLSYGLHTLWQARPVFLVGADVRFTLVSAAEIDPDELKAAVDPAWRRLPWTGPILVSVLPPKDAAERRVLMAALLQEGRDQEQLPGQYRAFEDVVPLMKKNARPLDAGGGDGNRAIPIVSRTGGDAWMEIDPVNGRPLRVVMR